MLVTKTIEGTPSYKYIDLLEPTAILNGLRSAIDAIRNARTANFPYLPPRWTTEQGMAENMQRLASSKTKHRELHPDFAKLSLNELKDIVSRGPDEKIKTLCHGDLCMPNILLNDSGAWTGVVDLGGLHIGDDKLDLAVMSWTVQANMGDKRCDQLLNTYGITAKDQGILYNRLAYDLGLERPNPWGWTQTPQLAEQRERLSE